MSFESALTGLNAAAASLDVTGHNIANGQTHGFKASRAEFADIFAMSHLGVAQNAIGQGVRLTNVQQMFEQGQPEFTQNALDMMVAGEGFFRMDNNGAISYTRAGNFQMDREGYIINPSNHRLTGFQVGPDGQISNATGPLRIQTGNVAARASDAMTVAANLPAFAEEMDMVDFDPDDSSTFHHSSTTTVFDSLGREHMISLYFVKSDDATREWQVEARLDGEAATTTVGVLNFGPDGTLDTINPDPPAITFNTGAGTPLEGANAMDLEFNLQEMTQFGSPYSVATLSQNGYAAGEFASLGVERDGTILARYTNGQTELLGQVALAKFPAPQNLQAVGDTAWVETFDSGAPIMGNPETGDFGSVQSGALEQANVNVSEQLVKMITAQRSYQANAKMISTQDAITQELMNIR